MKVFELKAQYVEVGECEDIAGITSPRDIVGYLKGAFDEFPGQEQFWVVCFDGSNKPICRKMLTLGLANQTQIHPREAFRFAILSNAVSVAFAHNHPSGSTKASREDVKITAELVTVGELLQIPILDHIIISHEGWSSMKSTNPQIFK